MQWSYATVQLTFYMDQGRKTRVYRLTLLPPPQKTPEDVRPQHHSCPFFSSLRPENRPSPPPEMSYRGSISLLTFCPFCPVFPSQYWWGYFCQTILFSFVFSFSKPRQNNRLVFLRWHCNSLIQQSVYLVVCGLLTALY